MRRFNSAQGLRRRDGVQMVKFVLGFITGVVGLVLFEEWFVESGAVNPALSLSIRNFVYDLNPFK
jgi:hypothetical protein